jgi:hypothetical protein
VAGAYTMSATGQGCMSLDPSAKECIKETGSLCVILLTSGLPGAMNNGIDGTATLDSNGDFTNATLKEGSATRTGCTGTWMPGNPSKMVVDCGGMGTSQSCVVTLTRTGDVCPF